MNKKTWVGIPAYKMADLGPVHKKVKSIIMSLNFNKKLFPEQAQSVGLPLAALACTTAHVWRWSLVPEVPARCWVAGGSSRQRATNH